MSDKFTVRLLKMFSICVELSRVITLGWSLLIVHFRSHVNFPMISFRFDFNVNLCICSWRVCVRLKNTAVVIGAYLLHTGGNTLLLLGASIALFSVPSWSFIVSSLAAFVRPFFASCGVWLVWVQFLMNVFLDCFCVCFTTPIKWLYLLYRLFVLSGHF